MWLLETGTLFWISALLYGTAATAAVSFRKSLRTASILSNALGMLAAASGGLSAALRLLRGGSPTVLADLRTTIPSLDLSLVLDDLSAVFLLGLSLLALCVFLYSTAYLDHYRGHRGLSAFQALTPLFVASMAVLLVAGGGLLFLVAWEVMSVLSFLLVAFESEKRETVSAALLYLVMTTLGTSLLLVAFLVLRAETGTFSLAAMADAIPAAKKNLLFILFLVGFGVKAGAVPVHVWLPKAHPAAPSSISALMSGVMLKTAVYGLLRFVVVVLGAGEAWWGVVLLAVGLVSAFYGVAHAYVENDMKRLLAYSSIENIGVILTGTGAGCIAIAAGRPEAGALCLCAALFHSFNHTLFKGGLFLGAGAVQQATGTRNLEAMGGLVRRMPVTSLFLLGGCLSLAAIVPFSAFASEWLTFQALFRCLDPASIWTSLAMIVSIAVLGLCGALAAATGMKLFGVAFLGKARTAPADAAREVPLPMLLGLGLPVLLGLLLGLAPSVFLRLSQGAVVALTGVPAPVLGTGFLGLSPWTDAVPSSISPILVPIALAVAAGAVLVLLRLLGGRIVLRRYDTWDCGFGAPDARMQYTATGFSKPVRIVLRFLFRPVRKRQVEGRHAYHPESIAYTVSNDPLVERYLYDPLVEFLQKASSLLRDAIQTGSLRRYLAYILAALMAVMLYNGLYGR